MFLGSARLVATRVVALVSLVKDRVNVNGQTNKDALLVGRSIFGEVDFKGIGVREHLRGKRLGLLQNLTQVRSVSVGIATGRIIDAERVLAATLATRVALGTAIDANSSTAGRGVHQINLVARVIEHLKRGDAEPARFLHTAKFGATTRKGGLLVAAALARSDTALTGTVHRDYLGLRVKFLDHHLVRVTRGAAHTAKAVGILQGMEGLIRPDEILEFRLGFASE